jgi:hypothetical protein
MSFPDMSESNLQSFNDLKTAGEPFFIYPCGGRTDIANIGFRPYDIYLCNYVNNFKPKLKAGLYNIGSVIDIECQEV